MQDANDSPTTPTGEKKKQQPNTGPRKTNPHTQAKRINVGRLGKGEIHFRQNGLTGGEEIVQKRTTEA